jgi:hypothetical protein
VAGPVSLVQALELSQDKIRQTHANLRYQEETLSKASKEYPSFLNEIRRWLNKQKNIIPKLSHHDVAGKTPVERWRDFQKLSSNKQQDKNEQIKMLYHGLSGPGLEHDTTFYQWVQGWHLDAPVFRKLYRYVWITILNGSYQSLSNWFGLLNQAADQMQKYPNYEPNSLPLQKQLAVVKKYITSDHLKESQLEELLSGLLEETLSDPDHVNYKAVYLQRLRYYFGLPITIQDFLYRKKGEQLFAHLVKRYLENRSQQKALLSLLNTFCQWQTQAGRENFCTLFDRLERNKGVHPAERQIIQNWLLSTQDVGDPRLSQPLWERFKHEWPNQYGQLLSWFNEQDFNFFFDFVFRDGADEHHRKELWKGYLYCATDFKAFLPERECIEFERRYKQQFNKPPTFLPIVNEGGQHAFVMKIRDILIYEVKETGNASYVYNLKILQSQIEHAPINKKSMIRDVLKFDQYSFSSKISLRRKKIHPKSLLAHTDLADDGKLAYSFKGASHWRFTHDQNLQWHTPVTTMMRQLYNIEWKAPKENNHASH